MSRREIIAYAISHAPRGQKGGPYTGNGSTANHVPSMALARRYALEDLHEAQADVAWLVRNEYTARVIRIVRKVRPSEASATPPIGHRDGGRLETARRLLAAVAEHMTEHAYQELASALGVDACRVGPSEASAARPASEALALRHASAVRAVLRAAKAWAKRWPRDRTLDEQRAYEIATARLLGAQARLAKIEKEVSHG